MKIIEDIKLDFKDVMFVPNENTLESRKDVSLSRQFVFLHSGNVWEGIPIIAANMDGVGTFAMAKKLSAHNMLTCLTKHYSVQQYVDFYSESDISINHSIYSMGISDSDYEKFNTVKNLLNKELKFVCVDVANGYTQRFMDFCKKIREENPDITLIAGNVVTPEITEKLILNGVDIVKIGTGPGSTCITRKQTGVGYPQLSAILECSDAAKSTGGYIISDGGCTVPGDVAKSFGASADFVMLGSMLAAHNEGVNNNSDIIIDDNGNKFVIFYGMSSDTAMRKHIGSVADYRSSEGKTVKLPFKGSVDNTILDLLGGVRSTGTYIGAKTLREFPDKTTFIRVNQQLNPIFNGKEI